MKKLLVIALVLAVTLVFSVAALAAKQSFYGFSIDVPNGWQAIEDKGDYSVTISALDGSESIKFKHASREFTSAHSFAQSAAYDVGGSNPVEAIDGDFEFEFMDNGVKVFALTKHIESWGIVMMSKNADFDRVKAILSSWEF